MNDGLKMLALPAASLLLGAVAIPPSSLDSRLATLSAPGSPGCAAGMIEGGRLVHARGYGSADIETGRPITPSTPFNLASMSKQFTGAAIALLVRDGRLSVEDDVRRYLPELPDYGETIRIRHLLHHSSGLRNHMALAAFQPTGPLPTHAEALALVFRQSAPNFRPGTRHQYESPNYVLLAEIVARVSGRGFEQFLAERIFAPLGMRNTGFSSPDLARAYAVAGDGGYRLNEAVNRALGSSGLISTVEDFAIWLRALDSGALGEDLLETMVSGTRLEDGTPISYSYGLAVDRDHDGVAGLTRIGHGGQTAAFRSTFSYFPGRGFGLVMLCNFSGAPLGVADAVVGEWLAAQRPAATAQAQPPLAPLSREEAARLAGTYHDPVADELRTFASEGETLKLVWFGQSYPLSHLGGGRFVLEGAGSFAFRDTPAGLALLETSEDQAPVSFAKLAPAEPRPAADYAGTYASSDVDGRIAIRVEGERLVMALAGNDIALAPVHTDGFAAFEAGFGRIAFTRDSAGRVDGLTMTTLSGISRMRFDRI